MLISRAHRNIHRRRRRLGDWRPGRSGSAGLAPPLGHFERVGLSGLDGGDSQRHLFVDPQLQQLVDEFPGACVFDDTAVPDPQLVAVADLPELDG